MLGTITKEHADLIRETYGEEVYQAVLAAPEGSTFLQVLFSIGASK